MKHDIYYSVVLTKYEPSWNIIFQRYIIVNDIMLSQQLQTNRSNKQKQSIDIMTIISKALH